MRDTTERPEALDAGTVKLVSTDKEMIIQEVSELINEPKVYEAMSKATNPYGDGKACSKIVQVFIMLTAKCNDIVGVNNSFN